MGIEKLKTIDDRKARKPLLERKRRARINESLSELKSIALQSLNKDSSRYTKMEKADILEMAVKHLKALRETVNTLSAADGPTRYREGFGQCASEVSRYVMTMDTLDHATRSDILSHLNTSCQSVYMSVPAGPASPPLSPALIQTRMFGDTPPSDLHYRLRSMTYPALPPFIPPPPRPSGQPAEYPAPDIAGHMQARPSAYRHPLPRLPHPQSTGPIYPRETSTATKETSRPEPVWRPW